jgi:anaerobic ribonucleoside-triphosphate reductase
MYAYEEVVKLLDTAEAKINKIDNDINALHERLKDVRGETTEVYSRIVGYYRNVNNWNPGKKNEYNHRKEYETAPNWMKPGSEK